MFRAAAAAATAEYILKLNLNQKKRESLVSPEPWKESIGQQQQQQQRKQQQQQQQHQQQQGLGFRVSV